MNYQFPEITGLKQIEEAIKGRSEFVVADRDWGFAVDYKVNLIDTFKATGMTGLLRRECRGIKFDNNGDLLARPFHKFFNLGEREETLPANVDFNQTFTILDKLDGSMIHPMIVDGQIIYCTKMGPTPVAEPVQEFADNHMAIRYNDFCWAMLNYGYTPIFEWCSPQQRIVVDHKEDNLILTAIRNTRYGEYMDYRDIKIQADMFDIPVVDVFGDTIDEIDAFAERVANMEADSKECRSEGCIVFFEGGQMLKLKSLKYLRIHKVQELLKFEKSVWKEVIDQKLDDDVGFLPEDDRVWLLEFQDAFWHRVDEVAEELEWKVIEFNDNHNKNGSQKKFAVNFVNNPDYGFKQSEKGVLFAINTGRDAKEEVLKIIGTSLGSQPNLDAMRPLMKNLKWK